jgi:hypothetical protein
MMYYTMTSDAVPNYYYYTWVSQQSVENNWGTSGYTYSAHPCISKALYDLIPDADWRKTTWIAPEDKGKAPGTKYVTLLSDDEFKKLGAYVGFKFRPGQGLINDYLQGNAVDIPILRIEEMYFIEAEARGFISLGAGKQVLTSFMNTYRYTDGSYTSIAGDPEMFAREALIQKRIEFWREGLAEWDFKRLKLQVVRGYTGTNFPTTYRFNSVGDGVVPAWMNKYIFDSEFNRDTAILPNPDASGPVQAYLWKE